MLPRDLPSRPSRGAGDRLVAELRGRPILGEEEALAFVVVRPPVRVPAFLRLLAVRALPPVLPLALPLPVPTPLLMPATPEGAEDDEAVVLTGDADCRPRRKLGAPAPTPACMAVVVLTFQASPLDVAAGTIAGSAQSSATGPG